MTDQIDLLTVSPILALLLFAVGYLLGERQERRRINDAADDLRETAALLRQRLDREKSVTPDDDPRG